VSGSSTGSDSGNWSSGNIDDGFEAEFKAIRDMMDSRLELPDFDGMKPSFESM